MAHLTDKTWRSSELVREAGDLKAALGEIARVCAGEAERLRRLDQAQCLRSLREEVARRVADLRRLELDARTEFTQGRYLGALMSFTIGGLMASASQSRERPFSAGVRLAREALAEAEDEPCGTVMVKVGPGGVPDDVTVLSISRMARERGMGEAQVVLRLVSQRQVLFTPRAFSKALEELERKVLDGTVSLPVPAARLRR